MRTASGTGYTRDAAIATLTKARGKKISEQTFYRWLALLCIRPKFMYSPEELRRLKQAAIHYRLGGTTEELKKSVLEDIKNARSRNSGNSEPIGDSSDALQTG